MARFVFFWTERGSGGAARGEEAKKRIPSHSHRQACVATPAQVTKVTATSTNAAQTRLAFQRGEPVSKPRPPAPSCGLNVIAPQAGTCHPPQGPGPSKTKPLPTVPCTSPRTGRAKQKPCSVHQEGASTRIQRILNSRERTHIAALATPRFKVERENARPASASALPRLASERRATPGSVSLKVTNPRRQARLQMLSTLSVHRVSTGYRPGEASSCLCSIFQGPHPPSSELPSYPLYNCRFIIGLLQPRSSSPERTRKGVGEKKTPHSRIVRTTSGRNKRPQAH